MNMATIRTLIYFNSLRISRGLSRFINDNKFSDFRWCSGHSLLCDKTNFTQLRAFWSSIKYNLSEPQTSQSVEDPETDIILYSPEGILKLTLKAARVTSSNRGFLLKKERDAIPGMSPAVYKMVLHNSEDTKKDKSKTKSNKIFMISSKITKNDLSIKVAKMNKLLEKGHKINVVLKGVPTEEDLNIKKEIQTAISNGTIVQQSDEKFTIIPNLAKCSQDGNKTQKQGNEEFASSIRE